MRPIDLHMQNKFELAKSIFTRIKCYFMVKFDIRIVKINIGRVKFEGT